MIVKADTNYRCELRPAVNHNDRRDGNRIDTLVLHYTGMADGDQALNWLCTEESQVSCHYLVHKDGRVVQTVREDQRAWHAGQSSWRGHDDINSRSIGIEIDNPGHGNGYPEFPQVQMDAVVGLCGDIVERRNIATRNVLAHSDIAPMRKQDPGEKFPWKLLHAKGIGHWVEATPIGGGRFLQAGESGQPVEALQSMLALYGYGMQVTGIYDEMTEACVTAFQRHFRTERVDGIADASTIDTLYRLIGALESA